MIEIDIKNTIANANEACMFFGTQESVCSLDSIKSALDGTEDKEVTLNIHCCGGSVEEGLAIYDYLRTSGKTIYTNIEGACHSMAIVLLLAAPKENRSANPNCAALIHKVSTGISDYVTSRDLDRMSESLKADEAKILSIYADRTGLDINTLADIMDEEKERNADELLKWGFISKINKYNTNMAKKTFNALVREAKKLCGKAINFIFTDENEAPLFETEDETDHLEIGMNATPDGTFELPKDTSEFKAGTVIVIADGAIASITEPEAEPETEPETEPEVEKTPEENKLLETTQALNEALAKIQDLEKNVENLSKENTDLKNTLNEMTDEAVNLKAQISSSYNPEGRVNRANTSHAHMSVEEMKDYMRKNK